MILVDTNVWSEATKAAPDPRVQRWARETGCPISFAQAIIGVESISIRSAFS